MSNFKENLKELQESTGTGPVIFTSTIGTIFTNFEWFRDQNVVDVLFSDKFRLHLHMVFTYLKCFDDFYFENIDMVKILAAFSTDGAAFKVRKIKEMSNLELRPMVIQSSLWADKSSKFQRLCHIFRTKITDIPEIIINIGTIIKAIPITLLTILKV